MRVSGILDKNFGHCTATFTKVNLNTSTNTNYTERIERTSSTHFYLLKVKTQRYRHKQIQQEKFRVRKISEGFISVTVFVRNLSRPKFFESNVSV